ncbi:MAG TPA: ATP-binding protein, partial [Gemmatimonadaceae bacterium]|nr:ATP-binding protein [Gemmatimonadaceae bacterium]
RTGGTAGHLCTCSPKDIKQYLARLSGPLADRIHMHITVEPVPLEALSTPQGGKTSAEMRQNVERVRAVQRERRRVTAPGGQRHAARQDLGGLTRETQQLLQAAAQRLALSARAYTRVVALARTIADLSDVDAIAPEHLAEALRYRGYAPDQGGRPPH